MKIFPGMKDRRRHKRFKVCDGAFAFINNSPFTIQNISKGGLRLQSVIYDDNPPNDMMLDIFLKNEDFYLQGIPVRLVSISSIDPKTPFSSIRERSFGLQFGEMTAQQKTRLDYFISRSATTEA